ncbi:MAG: DUF1778 domain-containing protein [Betaproteobacteria bacterium]|nr:DUF1778 domain-containing protein [Betaproteobacteria bacterium]
MSTLAASRPSVINLRAPAETRELIDQAARAQGKSRTACVAQRCDIHHAFVESPTDPMTVMLNIAKLAAVLGQGSSKPG